MKIKALLAAALLLCATGLGGCAAKTSGSAPVEEGSAALSTSSASAASEVPSASAEAPAAPADLKAFQGVLDTMQTGMLGTAGGSLKVTALAAELLNFSASYVEAQQPELTAAAEEFLKALDAQTRGVFAENLETAYTTAKQLAGKDESALAALEVSGAVLTQESYDLTRCDAVKDILSQSLAAAQKAA